MGEVYKKSTLALILYCLFLLVVVCTNILDICVNLRIDIHIVIYIQYSLCILCLTTSGDATTTGGLTFIHNGPPPRMASEAAHFAKSDLTLEASLLYLYHLLSNPRCVCFLGGGRLVGGKDGVRRKAA